MRTSILGWAALSALLISVSPSPSVAEEVDSATRGAARELGYEGVKAYQAGNYEEAEVLLEKAYGALPAPSLALWSGRALEKNGKLVDASERYLEGTRAKLEAGGDQSVQEKAQAEAKAAREDLLPRIPKLTVTVAGNDGEDILVTVGGKTLASVLVGSKVPTNPGEIEVTATWGGRTLTETVTLEESKSATVVLDFAAPESEPAPAAATTATPEDGGSGRWQRTAGWVGIGLGAAGIGFGTAMGVLALGDKSDLDESGCIDAQCPPGVSPDDYNSKRTLSTVGLAVGGVFAAAGITLLLTAPKNENTAYISPYLSLNAVGVKGAF